MTEQQENNPQEQANSSHEAQRDIVTVVLTADNHLGYDTFGQHKREERQQRLRDAFQQVVTFALGQKADFFIQAGDLFDTTTPTERDRSFVAARLAQLKQAGVRVIALGGLHDTPAEKQGEYTLPAPQVSYAQLGALQYLSPTLKKDEPVEPILIEAHGILVGVCGLGSVGEQVGDPLAQLRVQSAIERAALPILVLHAPIEGLDTSIASATTRTHVSRASIEQQHTFRYILAGYNHAYSHQRIGQTEVIVAGATHSTNSKPSTSEQLPGFVFMGLAADGLCWCNHIVVDALKTKQVRITTHELWSDDADTTPTERILERLEPLCDAETTIQLRLEGELTRRQYHQLDLNTIRHYGEEHCFSLTIDDSNVSLVSDQDATMVETGERFSPREELIAVVEEWIADAHDEHEKKALRSTKEELLLALDDNRGKW
ncbi:MAG: DNA repair exonuclease [Ktedonobacteraceae bacterium]